MKATDLMIGDWVNLNFDVDYKTGKSIYAPVQITGINKDGTIDVNCTFDKSESMQDGWDLKLIEPIPLTREILEKNGFEKSQGEKFTWFICNVAAFDIRIVSEKNNLYDIKIAEYPRPIKYVHELQHALKLCGIEKEIIL